MLRSGTLASAGGTSSREMIELEGSMERAWAVRPGDMMGGSSRVTRRSSCCEAIEFGSLTVLFESPEMVDSMRSMERALDGWLS